MSDEFDIPADFERFGAEHRALADRKLRRALEFHAEAYQLDDDGDMLGDYAVIAHWVPEVEDGRSRYTTHFDRHTIPGHVARGLFATGCQLVDARYDDETPT